MPLIAPPDPKCYEPQIVHQMLVQKPIAAYKQLLARKVDVRGPEPSSANLSLSVPFKSVHLTKLDSRLYSYLPFESMQLPRPGWWTERPTLPGYRDRYDLKLSLAGDKSTKLNFDSEGVPYVDKFPIYDILNKAPHVLTSAESKSIEVFKDRKSYTSLLQGKQVLCSEWLDKGVMFYRLEFNHNPDGSTPFIPAFITFEAKPAQYKRYINQIKACLQTIKWNDKVTIVQ